MRWRWWIYVIVLVFACSCAPHGEKEKAVEKPKERIVSRDEATGELPCFKCHSFEKFSSPRRGIFSHAVHRDAGYHCNQCHSFQAHHFMKTNSSLCNDCHTLKTFTYSASGFPARFNHDTHAKLGCKECHTGIFQMKKGSSVMTMDAMYRGKYCGACHNGKKAFGLSQCALCHEMKAFKKTITYRVEGIGNAAFSHEFHTQVFSCDQCHPKTFEMKKTSTKMTMDAMYTGKYCGVCHNGKDAFPSTECKKCHKT
ncbi:MAG TPA: cytochrome c3 family protein [Thermodesulfovibrionales bacterium]|nr:cytochrome c3 family protein [Thermodesulfovibrionales bacterium]